MSKRVAPVSGTNPDEGLGELEGDVEADGLIELDIELDGDKLALGL